MPSVIDLQEGELACGLGQTNPVPIMIFGSREFIGPLPLQCFGPSLVTQIVADKINVSSINQRRNVIVEQISHVTTKVFHPINVEFHIDTKVARSPRMRVLLVHMKGLFGLFVVEKGLNVRKVVTEGWDLAFFANVVRIQPGHLVRRRKARVAEQKGSLTGKIRNDRITAIALVDQLGTTWYDSFHGRNSAIIKERDSMTVAGCHIDVGS